MKFCPKCGAQLNDGQSFCSKCGHTIDSNYANGNINNDNENNVSQIPRNNFKFDLKAKIIFCVVIVLVAAGIGIGVVENNLSKPDAVVNKFKKAITSDDKSQLKSILNSDNSSLVSDDNSVESLIKYYKDNPDELNMLMDNLNRQAEQAAKSKDYQKDSSRNINVEYIGKKFLFFPEYKINVQPSYLEIKTSVKNVNLKIDNKDMGKSNADNFSKKYGPFMPVGHTISASYKGKYISLNKSYKVDLNRMSHQESLKVLDGLKYIEIDSNQDEAEVYVDDKDSGVKVKNAEKFGPVCSGTEIYGVIEKDGSKVKTRVYDVSSYDDDVYLNFIDSENQNDSASDVKGKVKELVNSYTSAFYQAVNSNSFSLIQSYVYPGSDLYNLQSKYIQDTYQSGTKEYKLDCEVVSVDVGSDNKSGTVTTNEKYDIRDKDGNTTTKTYKYKYTFKYNDSTSSFQLDSISNAE